MAPAGDVLAAATCSASRGRAVSPRRGVPQSLEKQAERAARTAAAKEEKARKAQEERERKSAEQAKIETDSAVAAREEAETQLFKAAASGDLTQLKLAEQALAEVCNQVAEGQVTDNISGRVEGSHLDFTDGLGKSALMWAAIYGHRTCVDYLIARGANVNARTKSMWTALHWAVTNEHTSCAESLIKAGADTGLRDRRGETALDFAKYNSNKGESIPLLNKAVDEMALLSAAEKGDLTVLTSLVDKGVDVNATDGVGKSAISAASIGGHRACVDVLISKGAKQPKVYSGHI